MHNVNTDTFHIIVGVFLAIFTKLYENFDAGQIFSPHNLIFMISGKNTRKKIAQVFVTCATLLQYQYILGLQSDDAPILVSAFSALLAFAVLGKSSTTFAYVVLASSVRSSAS